MAVPEKKGVCRLQRDVRALLVRRQFHSYQRRRLVTTHGAVWMQRAYYYCGRCRRGFLPYDEALGLTDEVSPGLMPLVCLAGTLLPFADAAQDLLQRFAGVRLSASTGGCDTEGEGERLRCSRRRGGWSSRRRRSPAGPLHARAANRWPTSAWMFSVPMQGIGAGQGRAPHALHRLAVYAGKGTHATWSISNSTPWRSKARSVLALGVAGVGDLIAITDGGNGLERRCSVTWPGAFGRS